jgi:hypothetical protein
LGRAGDRQCHPPLTRRHSLVSAAAACRRRCRGQGQVLPPCAPLLSTAAAGPHAAEGCTAADSTPPDSASVGWPGSAAAAAAPLTAAAAAMNPHSSNTAVAAAAYYFHTDVVGRPAACATARRTGAPVL